MYEGNCSKCGKWKIRVHKGICQSCYNHLRRKNKQLQAPKIKCQCSDECKEIVPSININGKPMKYALGHYQKGELNGMWKGGRYKSGDYWVLSGYYNHPNADPRGCILEHVLMMSKHLGRPLNKDEIVHHIIPVKEGGTNDISNLKITSRGKHQNIHNPRKGFRLNMSGRICYECKSDKTYLSKNGQPHWLIHPIIGKELVCEKCYKRLKWRKKNKV